MPWEGVWMGPCAGSGASLIYRGRRRHRNMLVSPGISPNLGPHLRRGVFESRAAAP